MDRRIAIHHDQFGRKFDAVAINLQRDLMVRFGYDPDLRWEEIPDPFDRELLERVLTISQIADDYD